MVYKFVLLIIANLLLAIESSEIIDERHLTEKNYEEWEEVINGLKQAAQMQTPDDEIKLTMYRDELRDKMMSFMENTEITDSYQLDDSDVEISSTDKLQLSKGTISHFDKIHIPRDENIGLNSSLDTLTWDIPVEFDKLQYNYHYNSKMDRLSDEGEIEGSISNPKYVARISYSVRDNSFSLDELVSKGIGYTNAQEKGSVIYDWIVKKAHETFKRNVDKAVMIGLDKAVWWCVGRVCKKVNELIKDMIFTQFGKNFTLSSMLQ